MIRQSAEYTPELLLNAWRQFQQAKSAASQNSITVAELTRKYYNRQVDQKRSTRTLSGALFPLEVGEWLLAVIAGIFLLEYT